MCSIRLAETFEALHLKPLPSSSFMPAVGFLSLFTWVPSVQAANAGVISSSLFPHVDSWPRHPRLTQSWGSPRQPLGDPQHQEFRRPRLGGGGAGRGKRNILGQRADVEGHEDLWRSCNAGKKRPQESPGDAKKTRTHRARGQRETLRFYPEVDGPMKSLTKRVK